MMIALLKEVQRIVPVVFNDLLLLLQTKEE